MAVIFASGGFGRCELEIGIAHQFVEQRGNGSAASGEASISVEALTAAGEVSDQGVDEHVGGASVKGDDLLWPCGSGNDGDVGDTPEIERDAPELFVAIEEIVGVWH